MLPKEKLPAINIAFSFSLRRYRLQNKQLTLAYNRQQVNKKSSNYEIASPNQLKAKIAKIIPKVHKLARIFVATDKAAQEIRKLVNALAKNSKIKIEIIIFIP